LRKQEKALSKEGAFNFHKEGAFKVGAFTRTENALGWLERRETTLDEGCPKTSDTGGVPERCR
jgi:hypothetical protein